MNETVQLAALLPQPEKQSANFDRVTEDDIELTEDEINTAIRKLKQIKIGEINQQRYWDKVKAPLVYPVLSSTEFEGIILKYAQSVVPGFILDNQNAEIFQLLCQYFTKNPEFEKDGYSLRKGLFLFGNIGCGKTTLMRIFQRNPTNDYAVKSCREVADDYTRYGADSLDKYSNLFDVYPHEHYGQSKSGICFDDLGTEKSKKHFGNQVNVMEDVFLNRYDKGLIGKTHLTTNLDENEIEEMYGSRVRSRLREMCNVIVFPANANDRRK
jgi:hypothetical protein